MDARRPHLTTLRRVALMAALAALLAPAGVAEAATKKRLPVVTSVSPMNAAVGQTLTIRGRNFRRGRARNSVVFKRDGARALFVKADVSTRKKMTVILPKGLEALMLASHGAPGPTKFRIRILARRFGKRFTALSRSPVIAPEPPPAPPTPPIPAADGDCDGDGTVNGVEVDDDDDLLTDEEESSFPSGFRTDSCKFDTDGDKVSDGYEYQSALDLNRGSASESAPYPYRMPYPNPLIADADRDFDGDGLWLIDEFRLWHAHGEASLQDLLYSDGKQKSRVVASVNYPKQAEFLARAGVPKEELLNMNGYPVPEISGIDSDYDAFWDIDPDSHYAGDAVLKDVEEYYYDQDLDGTLSDDERDEDGDGLSNWQESHGFATPDWWTHVYSAEKPYVNPFQGTDLTLWDTDGDKIVDGADDQDFDDVPNVRELRRQLVAGEVPDGVENPCGPGLYDEFVMGADPTDVCWNRPREGTDDDPLDDSPRHAWVQPFNPCLPNPRSRSCERYPNLGTLYPPFDADGPVFNVFDGQFLNPE